MIEVDKTARHAAQAFKGATGKKRPDVDAVIRFDGERFNRLATICGVHGKTRSEFVDALLRKFLIELDRKADAK